MLLSVALIAIGVTACLVWLATPKSDVPVFAISSPGWSGLSLRLEHQGSDILLLTRADPSSTVLHFQTGPVYRYDPVASALTEVSKAAWDEATGQIARFDTLRNVPHGWGVTVENGAVVIFGDAVDTRTVEVTGETALWVDESVASDLVAVLTVDGELDRPLYLWFFSRSGGYRGQHYVELFKLPEMTRRRPALRIPLTTADGIESPCWSSDGKYVVYSSSDGKRLCIIRTDAPEE